MFLALIVYIHATAGCEMFFPNAGAGILYLDLPRVPIYDALSWGPVCPVKLNARSEQLHDEVRTSVLLSRKKSSYPLGVGTVKIGGWHR